MQKLYTFPYHIHPLKTEEWAENEKQRLSPDAFAREILISYDFSAAGIVFSEFCKDHILEQPYQYNPDLPVYRAVDFGRTCSAVWAQRDYHGRFIFFRELVLEPSSTHELAKAVRDISYQYASNVTKPFDTCDPAGGTVSFTASFYDDVHNRQVPVNDIQICAKYGIEPQFDRIQRSKERLKEGVSLIKFLLSERNAAAKPTIIICRKGCPTLIESFQSGYRYKVDKSTQQTLDTIDERHPYEDVMDCLRYILMQYSAQAMERKPLVVKPKPFEPKHSGFRRR